MSLDDELLDSVEEVATQIAEYNYPLNFQFKIGTLANDFTVTDGSGKTVAYVKQKLFKLKEAIKVYSSESKKEVIYTIGADRIIDFNASYAFQNLDGQHLGHVGRKGMKSLLKASYEIYDNNKKQEFLISEENPWAKFWDSLLCEVPLLSLLSGYLFNPRYVVKRPDDSIIFRLSKEPSFWGRKFKLEKVADFDAAEGERVMLALMMMSLLERRRG
ncbi:MAG: hypothetical protein ABJG68_16270 [Crocinitomicaceae bacterium]